MQTQLGADDLGFNIITDDRHYGVDDQQPNAHADVAQNKGNNGPGDHNAAGAQNGHDVQNRDDACLQHGTFDSEEGEQDAQVTLGLEEDSEYEVVVAGEIVGTMKTNLSGKLNLSVELEGVGEVEVKLEKQA